MCSNTCKKKQCHCRYAPFTRHRCCTATQMWHLCEFCTLILTSAAEVQLNWKCTKKKEAHDKYCTRAVQGVTGQSLGWVASFYFSWLGKITCFNRTNRVWSNMCNPRSQRHSGNRPFHWILCTWPSSLSRPWWLWCWCYARLRATHTVKGFDRSKDKWA